MPFSAEDRRCALIAAAQHSLINRTQARRAGLSDQAIRYRVAVGRWRAVLPGVFLLAGGRMDDRAWMAAAYLWGRDASAVSHGSAAGIWGLDGFSGAEPYHLTIGVKRATPSQKIVLHSIDDPGLLEVEVVDGIGLTPVRKTLFDLAAIGHPRLERALDQALREGLVTLRLLWLMIDLPSSFGRRGVRRLRNLVAERDPSSAPTHSEMEDLFLRIVREEGFPRPIGQYPVLLSEGKIHVDFAYPEIRLAIECDSYAWHMDREAFERDRNRDAELQLLGWRVLRLTWAQLRYDRVYVAAVLRHFRP